MEGYIKFLENHVGEIEYGWSKDSEGKELPFQVVKYKGGPFPGSVTYSTLGVSGERLLSPVSDKMIRQEFVLVSYSKTGDMNIPGILQQVSNQALESKKAYLRGDVIGPYGRMFSGSELQALYVSLPVYFPDSFGTYYEEDNLPIVQVWLFPITLDEANFIRENGWENFEDMLVQSDPDLIDFTRSSILDR